MTTTMTMTTKTARFHAMWARLAALLALLLVMGVLAPHARAQTTSITFFHNDVLGSPAVATDASGAVVWKESYLPYGHRLQAPAAAANNKLWYAGKQLDPNTGLSYMGARYYSPVVGRFMGMDPKEFSPENPHSLNRYAYGNNNPYKYVDPDGKIAETVWDAFNLSIGFHSLVSNVRAGNWSGAAVDGVGMALDGVAAAVPLMPGGAAAGIAAYRVGNAAVKGLPDSALVYRGGACKADNFLNGSGVTRAGDGTLNGVSTQSRAGASVDDLAKPFKNNQVGVTTAGDIRHAGGRVTADGHPGNPNHATVDGLTEHQLERLFSPTRPNPVPPAQRGF